MYTPRTDSEASEKCQPSSSLFFLHSKGVCLTVTKQHLWILPLVLLELPHLTGCKDGDDSVPERESVSLSLRIYAVVRRAHQGSCPLDPANLLNTSTLSIT